MQSLLDLQASGFSVKALDERPILKSGYVWLYDAFNFLSPSRTLGAMGEYYIPLTEYSAYFSIFNLNDIAVREFMLLVLTQVDRAMLKLTYEEKTSK